MKTNESGTSPIISDQLVSVAGCRRATLTPEDRQRLLLENLSEVRHIARRIHLHLPRHVPFDDLVHEGVVGLIDALEKFNPSKNIQLRTYARFRIRGAILDSLRELDWGPRHLRRKARRIEQISNELASKLGRVPSEPEVAAQLGVSLTELQQILVDIHCLRLDTLETSCESVSQQQAFNDRPDCTQDGPFDRCFKAERTQALRRAIATLTQQEHRALTLYYFDGRTMKEIGKVLAVHESRVSQIITKALGRLRLLMQNDQQAWAEACLRSKRSWR